MYNNQGQYPPQQGVGYPPQQGGGYPPQGYPPQQGGGYPHQQGGGYPQQGGGYPPQQGGPYPPQQGGFGPQYGAPQPGQSGFQGGHPGGQAYQSGMPPPGGQRVRTFWYDQYRAEIGDQERANLAQWFQSVDRDGSKQIDVTELSNMPCPPTGPMKGKQLGLGAAQILIRLFDRDKSGTIDFDEYLALHKFMDRMSTAFFQADADRSGYLEMREIHQAMQNAGFAVNDEAIQLYFKKFNQSGRGLDFLNFMHMAADMGIARSQFEWADRDADGKITFDELLLVTGNIALHQRTIDRAAVAKTPTAQAKEQGGCLIC